MSASRPLPNANARPDAAAPAQARPGWAMGLAQEVHRLIPTLDEARRNRALRWLGPLLDREWLWHLNGRTVATGAALGVFFGLIVPVAQLPFAAAGAILLRANLPAAALGTLVSNPFTVGPIYWLAHLAGSAILGPAGPEESGPASADGIETVGVPATSADWIGRIADVGAPLMVGLALFAAGGALFAYLATRVVWRLHVVWQRRRRRADDA
jgi:uncharacterized protein (DUF2062 family)